MTPEQARQLVVAVLAEIAPEADPASLDDGADLRSELELDSLDFLNYAEALSERSGVRIEEDDYPKVATLGSAAEFLAGR